MLTSARIKKIAIGEAKYNLLRMLLMEALPYYVNPFII